MASPSDAKKGFCAPSVPTSRVAVTSSRDRKYRAVCPGCPPRYTRRLPSRDMAAWLVCHAALRIVNGSSMLNRVSSRAGVAAGRDNCQTRAAPRTPPASAAVASHHPVRDAGVGVAVGFRTASAAPPAIQRNSRPRSRAVCQRSSGSLARHVATTRSSAAGASVSRVEIGGGSRSRIAAITLAWLRPSKAFSPVAISCSTAPKAKMSVRASVCRPSTCSGAMYCSVPTMVPCVVRLASWVDNMPSGPDWLAGSIFARPKSSSLMPDFVSMMLPGLRSR